MTSLTCPTCDHPLDQHGYSGCMDFDHPGERDNLGFCPCMTTLAELLPAALAAADQSAALEEVKREARVEALRETAQFFEREMAQAWGGDDQWLTTGARVAGVVADVLREQAADLYSEAPVEIRNCTGCGEDYNAFEESHVGHLGDAAVEQAGYGAHAAGACVGVTECIYCRMDGDT